MVFKKLNLINIKRKDFLYNKKNTFIIREINTRKTLFLILRK